jgi:hypothetical protein
MTVYSRRTILKSIGLVGLALTPFQQAVRNMARAHAQGAELPPFPARWNGEPLGRVTSKFMNARAEPTTEAEIVKELVQHDIVRVRRALTGQLVFWHNDLWLETDVGYLYSSFVQPMKYVLPQVPQRDLGTGRWAEVIVPWTDAYWEPAVNEERFVSRQYYSSVYFVKELVTGSDGKSWYLVEELYQSYYMRATHLKIIPPEALTPLSPHVDPRDKWIEVSIDGQYLVAYEGETPVYAHLVSTGLPDFATPEGLHRIHDKRPGTRMIGGAASDDEEHYNLTGVPFTCYFTGEWAATHGTYWHNDYGTPRSHGCVNLPPDAARWVWRWTTPAAPYEALYARPETGYDGTKVYVG